MGCVSAARKARKLKAAIHVDTGMNRLGLTVPQGLTLKDSRELKDFETALLMSHFVSAEESDNPLNVQQIEAFQAVKASLPGIPASLANSSGIFLKEKPHFDLARPGYALYGGNPTPDRDNPMRAVVGLEGRIVQLRWVEADHTVGYNGRWLALDAAPHRDALGRIRGRLSRARRAPAARAATSCSPAWRSWRASPARLPATSPWT